MEVPEEVMFGPKMRALSSDRQRKFCWLMASGAKSAAECARQAGYEDNGSIWDNSKSGVRVTAHRLAHDPKVQEAIEEATRATLQGLAPIAVKHARMILEDRKHPYHGRMIEAVLDRTGFFARSEHVMKVEHAVDERAMMELARKLAAENGIDVKRLLGEGVKQIEGEVVQEIDTRP
jgi:phage terminase small subunit